MSGEPGRIAMLHHDKHGRPVPWFVAWIDGQPDFRVIKPGAIGAAVTARLCWVCGVLFARQEPRAFLIGPMCAVNRTSAEPPSHYDCAAYSAMHCPFLATPRMTRRERHLPEGAAEPAGFMIRRNPGVALIWVTRYNGWAPFRAPGGLLFDIGEPEWVEWYAQGRRATRTEVLASIDSGLPILRQAAEAEGAEALADLDRQHAAALELVPG